MLESIFNKNRNKSVQLLVSSCMFSRDNRSSLFYVYTC